MIKSDSISELAGALCKAQGEIENASKNASNPHFRSKYADLAEVLNTVRPVMSKNGISISQFPAFEAGVASVETIVMHTSGEWMSGISSAPVQKQDAQGVGSALTYLRRYSLAAIAGIAQEDDDANSSIGGKQQTQQKPQQNPQQKLQTPDPDVVISSINKATSDADINKFVSAARNRGVDDAGMERIQEAAVNKISELGGA